ncbi:MAG: hypothetical protein MPN21_24250 [Thermoanaerobaculia bacterium]|nr:hypothetical protein [Thermoanaerobaculia bacterium]
MSTRLTAIFTLLALGFSAAPVQAIRCVDPAFLDRLTERVADLDRQTPEALDALLAELADRRYDVWCGEPEPTGGFWLAEGDYWIWRNHFADLWLPLVPRTGPPASGEPEAGEPAQDRAALDARSEEVGRRLAGLAEWLRKTYPDGDYSDVTFYPYRAAGRTLTPVGFQDGTGGLEEVESLQRDLQELRRAIDSDSPNPTSEAERKVLLTQLEREIGELLEGLVRRRGAPTPDEARSAPANELDPGTVTPQQSSTQGATSPPQTATGEDQGRDTQPAHDDGGDAGTEASNAESSKESGDEAKERGTSDRKGRGGILPSGAPPWLTDIFQMVLTYFGVKDIVQAVAMAIYLLEPELLEQLADLTGGLTDGLRSDELDQLLEVVQEIYSLYSSVASLTENLANSENFQEVVKALSDSIEELPEDLKRDLDKAMGADLSKHLGEISNLSGVLTEFDLEGLQEGKLFSDAAAEQIRVRVVEEVEQRATEELTKVVGDLGIPGLDGEAALRLLEGDTEGAAELAQGAMLGIAARHTGLSPNDVEDVLAGDFDKVAARQAEDLARDLWDDLGLPDPAVTGDYADAVEMLADGRWQGAAQKAVEEAVETLPEEEQDFFRQLEEDPRQALENRAAQLLVEETGLDEDTAKAILDGKPLPEIARQHVEDLAGRPFDPGGVRDRVEQELLKKAAEELAGQDPELADLLSRLSQGKVTAEELQHEVLRSAERRVLVLVEDKVEIPLRRVRAALPPDIVADLDRGKSLGQAVRSHLAKVRATLDGRAREDLERRDPVQFEAQVKRWVWEKLPDALPEPFRSDPDVRALLGDLDQAGFDERLEAILIGRVQETLGLAPLDLTGDAPGSLLQQLAHRSVQDLTAGGQAMGLPPEAVDAWLDGDVEKASRALVAANDPASVLRRQAVAALGEGLVATDGPAVLSQLTKRLWQGLPTPWDAIGAEMLGGKPTKERLASLLQEEFDRLVRAHPAADPATLLPPEVAGCRVTVQTADLGVTCDENALRSWAAATLHRELQQVLPDQKILTGPDVADLVAGRAGDVAQRLLRDRVCPGTEPDRPCSLETQAQSSLQGLRTELLDMAKGGTFVLEDELAQQVLEGDRDALAGRWEEMSRDRIAAALGSATGDATTPLQQVHRSVWRAIEKAEEPATADDARTLESDPLWDRRNQLRSLQRIEYGQRLRECVTRNLLPPEDGTEPVADPLKRCQELAAGDAS